MTIITNFSEFITNFPGITACFLEGTACFLAFTAYFMCYEDDSFRINQDFRSAMVHRKSAAADRLRVNAA